VLVLVRVREQRHGLPSIPTMTDLEQGVAPSPSDEPRGGSELDRRAQRET
jgi:hypothetical protein